jgi:Domain of unknown function (DUF5666)
MSTNRPLRFLAALALLALFLPAVAQASRRTASVSGQLVASSNAAQTLTVRAADGQQVILHAARSSRLSRNGASARLADLALRDDVTAQFDRGNLRLISLAAHGPAVSTTRGSLLGLDPGTSSLSVLTPSGRRELRLTSATLFVRNGRAANAGDLTSRDALVIHSVAVGGGQPEVLDVEADGPEEEEIEGTITGIAGSDVTITPNRGKPVTVHVGASTRISLRHGHGDTTAGTLADLQVGMKADAEFDPVSFLAFKVEAEREAEVREAHIQGKVTAVDAGARKITIDPERSNPVTLAVDGSTRIRLNGAAAHLADIPVGAKAEAEFDASTNLANKIEAEDEDDDDGDEAEAAEVEGKVTAVSAASITIAPGKSGSPVTLTLNASTVITIGHSPGTAADIHTGDEAEARYDRATKVALRVKVEREHDGDDDD